MKYQTGLCEECHQVAISADRYSEAESINNRVNSIRTLIKQIHAPGSMIGLRSIDKIISKIEADLNQIEELANISLEIHRSK